MRPVPAVKVYMLAFAGFLVFSLFPPHLFLLSPARNLPDPVDVGGGDKKADLQPKHGRAVWQIRVRVQHVCDGSRSDSSASEVRL